MLLVGSLGLSSKEETVNHKLIVGSNLGLNLNSSEFNNLGLSNTCCQGFESGFGTGLNFGFGYGYLLNDKLMISTGVDFTNLKADFIEYETESIGLDGTNKRDARIEQKVISELSSIGLNLMATMELFDNFDAGVGYRLGIPNDLSYRQTETLLEPDNGVFKETQSRIRNDESGTISNNLSHSIISKLAYRISTSKNNNTYLSPNISFNIGLNSINDEMNLRPNSINFGVDFTYSIVESQEERHKDKKNKSEHINNDLAVNDDLAINIQSNEKKTRIVLKPVSTDENKKHQDKLEIVLDEVKSLRMLPILNYVFFDKDSSSLPIRYSLLTKKDSYNFNTNNLFEVETIDIYHHILNIIGERMKEYSKAKLKIVGTKSSMETGELAKILPIERAKTIRNYLVNVWGIDLKRLEISSIDTPYIPSSGNSQESIEENQRVEFYSDNDKLLSPLLLQDTLYTPVTKKVTFYTVIDTNIKVFSWDLKIFDDENSPIFESSGRSTPPLTNDFLITEEIATKINSKNMLTYRFDLQSENEENESVTGRIPINIISLQDKETAKKDDKRIDKYSLILFEFDKYELNKKNQEILKIVKDNISKNSELIISGYSDKIGEASYNKELSKKRTEAVAKEFMTITNKELFPYGESIILFNNNIPEGRFYSRTVQIKAITPLKK